MTQFSLGNTHLCSENLDTDTDRIRNGTELKVDLEALTKHNILGHDIMYFNTLIWSGILTNYL